MTATTTRDIPLLIKSATVRSERRITPSWTITQLKQKLEFVTGIPPSAQKLTLRFFRGGDGEGQGKQGRQGGVGEKEQQQQQQEAVVPIEADDEDSVQIARWGLVPGAEIEVQSLFPNTTTTITSLSSDTDSIPKYTMPVETYAALPDTVLAYKRENRIGRFDPAAPETQKRKAREMWDDVRRRDIHPPLRCRISPTRHGTIAYVGPVPELPGISGAPYIGIILDEPVGKNDGSVASVASVAASKAGGADDANNASEESGVDDADGHGKDETGPDPGARKRYFECEALRGVFVRPERVELGNWGFLEIGEDGDEEVGDLEEI